MTLTVRAADVNYPVWPTAKIKQTSNPSSAVINLSIDNTINKVLQEIAKS